MISFLLKEQKCLVKRRLMAMTTQNQKLRLMESFVFSSVTKVIRIMNLNVLAGGRHN